MTNNYLFFYAEKEENRRLPFQRKRQDKINCCPFDREPHPNEAIQIGAYKPGKGRGDTKSAQEDKQITEIYRSGESLMIL